MITGRFNLTIFDVPIRRRTLLAGSLALALAPAACRPAPAEVLRVIFLKGSVAPRLVQGFRQQLAPSNRLKPQVANGMGALFQQLQQWHQPNRTDPGWRLPIMGRETPIADWVSLGDYWLTAAIQQGLIQALPEVEDVTDGLPASWRSLLQRNQQGSLDATGPLWAMPYRWGSLVLVYARRPFQRLGWEPTHWQDLWRPELAGRISLPSHPRLALGLMLKGLGESANHPEPGQVSALLDLIEQGQSQVKTYASSDYIQPLLREDTWLAVGWSTDVLPRLENYRQLAAVVPEPGTLLSADVWVRPNSVSAPVALTALDQQWLSYWLNPAVAEPLQAFSYGASPLLLEKNLQPSLPTPKTSQHLLPTLKQRQSSDFLLPLTSASQKAYQGLWQQLGGGK
ncbi:MAG: extracellular solute-binding protein [Cyanobacteria bacterium]|nr:extracellular solute-binding protein [Cyanobacteriota bacterium]MDA0866369.1 extracellular solute-binding protein [Cyanobacteriota bacterium]